jgi:hypothetical protein
MSRCTARSRGSSSHLVAGNARQVHRNDMPDDFVSCRQSLFHSFPMPASQGRTHLRTSADCIACLCLSLTGWMLCDATTLSDSNTLTGGRRGTIPYHTIPEQPHDQSRDPRRAGGPPRPASVDDPTRPPRASFYSIKNASSWRTTQHLQCLRGTRSRRGDWVVRDARLRARRQRVDVQRADPTW